MSRQTAPHNEPALALDSVPVGATISAVLSHVVVVYLVCVLPWLGRARHGRLKRQIEAGDADARSRFYRRALAVQLGLILTILAICLLGSIPAVSLGLAAPACSGMTAALAAFLVTVAVSTIVLRYKGDRRLKRALQMAGPLLPVSTRERWLFAVVAVGAGVSEELAFRGFLLFYLGTFLRGLGLPGAVLVCSAVFGLGHLYQGARGMVITGLVGLFLAIVYVLSGSLLVPMVAHAALDLRLLAIFTPERLRKLGA